MQSDRLRTKMTRLALRSLRPLHRSLASIAPGPPPPQATTPFEVFDRQAKRRQKDRAATRDGGEKSRVTDYLRTEVADRMFERFEVGLRVFPWCGGGLTRFVTRISST